MLYLPINFTVCYHSTTYHQKTWFFYVIKNILQSSILHSTKMYIQSFVIWYARFDTLVTHFGQYRYVPPKISPPPFFQTIFPRFFPDFSGPGSFISSTSVTPEAHFPLQTSVDLLGKCTPITKNQHALCSISKLLTPFWKITYASHSKLCKELKYSIKI